MARKRRRRGRGGRPVLVIAIILMVLLLAGGAIAGVAYVLTRPGVWPGGGPGGLLPSGAAYENTPQGLEKAAGDLVADRRAGTNSRIKEAVKLPEKWFVDVFGAEQGPEYYKQYYGVPQTPEQFLDGQIDDALRLGVVKIQAEAVDRKYPNPVHYKMFAAMKGNVPALYRAQMQNPPGAGFQAYIKDQPPSSGGSSSVGVGDFVYVDGSWRFFCPNIIWPR